MILAFGSIFVVVLVVWAITASVLQHRRSDRLATYRFPAQIIAKLQATYPHLTPQDCERVMLGLRQFFALTMAARGRQVAMPSKAVDLAWHEFILSTRAYQRFCRQVLGRFLHHTPTEAMPSPRVAEEGLRRAWRLACADEGLNPVKPSRPPLLFALDAELAIPEGLFYSAERRRALAAGAVGSAVGGCVGYSGSSCGGHGGCGASCGGGCGGN